MRGGRPLAGRVAIVTGAGRGLGRAHAIRLASEGAAVVVNDLGTSVTGVGIDPTPAHAVVGEIVSAGGTAVASNADVSSWAGAKDAVQCAIASFGHLDVLVNNAGIVRDRTLVSLDEREWDDVLGVHLKGYAATTHHAMAYWRHEAKAGRNVRASLIHTSSVAAFAGNFGQAAYCAAKAGILALSRVAALEGARYGVRSNAIAPSARTRLLAGMADAGEVAPEPQAPDAFDRFSPANVSPVVAWLALPDCPARSQIFYVMGNEVTVVSMPRGVSKARFDGQWTLQALNERLTPLLVEQPVLGDFLDVSGTGA